MKRFTLQPANNAAVAFQRSQDAFGEQEAKVKVTKKNLDILREHSAKLDQRVDSTKQILQSGIPRAQTALKDLDAKPN